MLARLRRLQADFEALSDWAAKHDYLDLIGWIGDPPEQLEIVYRLPGLVSLKDGRLEQRLSHQVVLTMPLDYPRIAPRCRMIEPLFHPNVDSGIICVGERWASGQTLPQLAAQIGELICWQQYSLRAPRNRAAARWAAGHADHFPLFHGKLS